MNPAETTSTLGWSWSSFERTTVTTTPRFFRRSLTATETETVAVAEWLIDDVPLTERLRFPNGRPCEDTTLVKREKSTFAPVSASLHALVSTPDEGSREQPVAFSDGRVMILYCPCGDFSCGGVSAEIVRSAVTVEWRDIAIQFGYDEQIDTSEIAAFSLTFDRTEYEATINNLIDVWERERSADQRGRTS